jgi:prolyl-tRNA synthetase
MKQSQLFTKVLKEAPADEKSTNAKLLTRGGFVDKLFAGVYSFLPLGWLVMKKIENIIREEMNIINGQEIYMPALHPIENYKKTGREKLDILFYTDLRTGTKLVLGQSHEEVIVPLMQKFILSYRDLPKAVYQFQTKFRNELRAKSGILRGREFIMKDLYSFHADEKDLDNYYEQAKNAYFKVFERCGLKDMTYLTFASGGTFSKYSHEFQTLTDAGEDIIYICDKCKIAINKEIIEEQKHQCPECFGNGLREEKAIEVGNIFKLKTRFSDAFGLKVPDEQGKDIEVSMGCYGIGLSRLMGTIVEIYNDEKGIIWPEEVSPFKAHLIVLQGKESGAGKIIKSADKLYENLIKNGIEVLYDDRRDRSAGEKLIEADLIGIPYRIIISEKTLEKGSAEIKKRGENNSKLVDLDKVVKIFNSQ